MQRQLQVIFVLTSVLYLFTLGATSDSWCGSYTEDFTTLDYCDTAKTTALWDTGAGELKLHPFAMTVVGVCDTFSSVQRVTVVADYAYVGAGGQGLMVVDISDPANPVYAGGYDTPGTTVQAAIAGDYAYLADCSSGLQVIDITDPTNPSLAGSYDTDGVAVGIALAGDYAYIADSNSGLAVIDISNPGSPTYAGGYNTPGSAQGVSISGDYAYVGDGTVGGLQVLDISDPTNPTPAGSYDTPGMAYGATLSGDYAYVADGFSGGVLVLDISDPTSPTYVGDYDTPGYAYWVSLWGDRAFVADGTLGGVHVLDISNPASPVFEDSLLGAGYVNYVALAGDHAFVTDSGTGLLVVDIADPVIPPVLVGSNGFAEGAYSVAVSGDYAYVSTGIGATYPGLLVFDITDPGSPTLVDSVTWAYGGYSVSVDGDYAYVCDIWSLGSLSAGTVVDISDPTNLAVAGSLSVNGISYDARIAGDYLFFAGADGVGWGVFVFDISDPTNPDSVAMVPTALYCQSLDISGDYLYAGAGGGLEVIDISDPTSPVIVGWAENYSARRQVKVWGDYAFVTGWTGQPMYLYDISDAANPDSVTSYSFDYSPYRLDIAGDYALVGISFAGLAVMDISDPANASVLGVYQNSGRCKTPVFAGRYAYLADEENGLEVLEVFERDLDLEGDVGHSKYVYRGNEIDSVKITTTQTGTVYWEVSADSGANWQEIEPDGQWQPLTHPGRVLFWRSRHVYTGDGVNPTCGNLQIEYTEDISGVADTRRPSVFSLSPCAPTPFSASTTIRFALPEARKVRLAVHDVLGRQVATLVDGELAPDWYTHPWNGTGDGGGSLSPGIYFVRFDAGDFMAIQKTVLLR